MSRRHPKKHGPNITQIVLS